MPHSKKIVLVCKSGPVDIRVREKLIQELLDDRIELFCTVGPGCETWEDEMDWICVMAQVETGVDHLVLTTSHQEESIESVMQLARQISVPSGAIEIEVITV
jgi:hypothetical protein